MRMLNLPRIVLLLVFAAAPALAQSTSHSLYATVVDRGGMPIDGLGASDFIVQEDGTTQNVVSVVPAGDPIDIAIIVSMSDGNISDVRQGIVDFFNAIRGPHEIALTSLGRPRIAEDYTRDANTFLRSVKALYPQRGQGAYATVSETVLGASQTLRNRGTGRRAIIVVSDGSYGRGAVNTNRELQGELRASGAALYVVVVDRSQPPFEYPNGTYYIRPAANVSWTIPKESGGRITPVLASSGVPAALAGIANDLNHQYRVDYVRPSGGVPNSLEVTVGRPELTVRAARLAPK